MRENFPQLNRYNLDCTRVVVHIYVSFTWYNFSEIIPTIQHYSFVNCVACCRLLAATILGVYY